MAHLPAPAPASTVAPFTGQPLEALAAGWLVGYRNANTRAAYGRDLGDFITWCAERDLDPLTVHRSHFGLYARGLEAEGRSAATVARRLSALAGFFRWCEEEAVIDHDPAARVRRPRVPKESPTLGLDKTETEALLAATTDPRDLALVLLLTLNGLRVSEAIAAQADDLSTERGHRTLEVRGKGDRVDRVPLAPRTAEALEAVLAGRDSGTILLTDDGRPWDRHRAAYRIRRLARAAGLDKRITPHSLRHTGVTLALDAGVPLRDVQDFARHADPRTTRRYDRGRASLDRHATYALAAFVA